MSTSIHAPNSGSHIHDIAKRLQQEVNFILENIDETSFFAEFRKEEIVDFNEDTNTKSKKDTVQTSLDERIIFDLSHQYERKRPLTVKRNIKNLPKFISSLISLNFKG